MSALDRLIGLFLKPPAEEQVAVRRERRPRAPVLRAGVATAFLRPSPSIPVDAERRVFAPPEPGAGARAAQSDRPPLDGLSGVVHRDGDGAPPGGPSAALLCAPGDALAVGVSLALELRRSRRARTALIGVWPPDAAGRAGETTSASAGAPANEGRPPGRGSAWPSGRRLVASLMARGLDARAAGPVAVVALDADPTAAAASFSRAMAAAGDAPVVLVVGGPRPAELDALLARSGLAIVATRPGIDRSVGELTVTRLAEAGVSARALPLPPALPGRALAAAGLLVPPGLRTPLAELVRGPA